MGIRPSRASSSPSLPHPSIIPAVELGSVEGDVSVGVKPTFLLHVTLCFLLTQRNRVSQECGVPLLSPPDLLDPASSLPFILAPKTFRGSGNQPKVWTLDGNKTSVWLHRCLSSTAQLPTLSQTLYPHQQLLPWPCIQPQV